MKTPKPETDDAKTQNAKNLLVLGFWRPKIQNQKACGTVGSPKVEKWVLGGTSNGTPS